MPGTRTTNLLEVAITEVLQEAAIREAIMDDTWILETLIMHKEEEEERSIVGIHTPRVRDDTPSTPIAAAMLTHPKHHRSLPLLLRWRRGDRLHNRRAIAQEAIVTTTTTSFPIPIILREETAPIIMTWEAIPAVLIRACRNDRFAVWTIWMIQ